MREYGEAIAQLATANIFAGDLLFKNFGVTRYGRVIFYDYDEIEYLTDCRFRRIPQPPPGFDEMSADVWYPVGPRDVFPEEFATFLLTDPRIREAFLRDHANLLDAALVAAGPAVDPWTARCPRCSRIPTACASAARTRVLMRSPAAASRPN